MTQMASKKHSLWFHIFDVVLNIVIIVAIVGVIRTFLVSPFQVEGSSMVDTLENKEYIIINKLAYHLGEPQRGDVVVFRPPTDRSKHYVKRIIGTPGDQIIISNGLVFLKEKDSDKEVKLNELYLNDRNSGHTYQHPPSTGNKAEIEYIVPEDNYFLLGDNRQGSLDSRSFDPPYVPSDDIKGKVWFIALPISKIQALEPPDYGFSE